MSTRTRINSERLRSLFVELCRIPSPSRNEKAVAEYIRSRLAGHGLSLTEDGAGRALGSDCGNLHLRLQAQAAGTDGEQSTKPPAEALFLAAHMDTVPPDPEDGAVPVCIEGDRVHTQGRSVLGGDDKLGIAAALELVLCVVEDGHPLPRNLDIVFTVQEELGAKGAAFLDTLQLEARHGYVLDGEGPVFSAIIKAPYKYRYSVDVQGRRSHAAVAPDAGRNAVAAAGELASRLPQGRPSPVSTANVGSISGGGPSNIVPDSARLVGEIRSFDPAEITRLQTSIERLVAEVEQAREVKAQVEWEHLYDGYEIAQDETCLELFATHCRRNGGKEPELFSSLGGGDANALNSKGVRSIVFGLGMHNIHSPDEYALFSELEAATELLYEILLNP